MPPVISKTGEQGISAAAARRTYYLSEDEANSSPGAIGSTEGHLRNLIAVALGRCNIRDYVTLLIELSMLRLALDTGPPTLDALELAQAVNPFLNRQPGDVSISGGPSQPGESSTSRSDGPLPRPFRDTDTAMVTDTEKHLLVLLYYCDLSNLRKSPDEAVAQLSKVVWKYGNLPSIDLRKESFTETEVAKESTNHKTSAADPSRSISTGVSSTSRQTSPTAFPTLLSSLPLAASSRQSMQLNFRASLRSARCSPKRGDLTRSASSSCFCAAAPPPPLIGAGGAGARGTSPSR